MEISSLATSGVSVSSIPKPTICASSNSKSSLFVRQSSWSFFRSGGSGLGLSLTRPRPTNPTRKNGFSCNAMFGLGVPEIAVIAGVAVLLFGPKQLPEIGRSMGKTLKGFQQAAKEFETELKKPEEPKSDNEEIEAKAASSSSEEKENVNVS